MSGTSPARESLPSLLHATTSRFQDSSESRSLSPPAEIKCAASHLHAKKATDNALNHFSCDDDRQAKLPQTWKRRKHMVTLRCCCNLSSCRCKILHAPTNQRKSCAVSRCYFANIYAPFVGAPCLVRSGTTGKHATFQDKMKNECTPFDAACRSYSRRLASITASDHAAKSSSQHWPLVHQI